MGIDDSESTSSSPERMIRAVLGSLAFVLAAAGHITLLGVAGGFWPGLTLIGAAAAIFLYIHLARPPAQLATLLEHHIPSRTGILVACASVSSVAAAVTGAAFQTGGRTDFTPVLILWLGGAVLYVAAFNPGLPAPTRGSWLVTHGPELIAITLVLLGAAVLRFYRLGAMPAVINGDEGLLGQAALHTAQLPLANPFALFENFGGLYMQAIGLGLHLLGRTPFALRVMPAIGGTAAVAAVYGLARYLLGGRVAVLAAGLLAMAHMHIHFSRTVAVGYIQGTFLAPVILFLLISGLEMRSALRTAAAGVVLGVYFSIYLGAQILAGMLLLYLVLAGLLCRPLIQRALRPAAAFVYGAALIGLPQLAYSLRQPEEFLARLNASGTFHSGWLANEMAVTGRPAALILAERVAHAFLSLIYYPALDFYGTPLPGLGLITATLFVLGLGYALQRVRDPRFLLLNGYFWSAPVAIGVFATPPAADSYRMLLALPAACIFAALGLDRLTSLVTLDTPAHRRARRAIYGVFIGAVMLINLRAYFVDFTGRCRYGSDIQTRFASYLGNYVRGVDREAEVYLLSDDTKFYGSHSSVDFLSNDHPITNVPGPLADVAPAGHGTLIAIAERADELRAWAAAHPGGALESEYDCDRLMLLAYRIP